MMKMSDIQTMEASGIDARISELRRELFDLRLQKHTTSLEKPHLITGIKKDIARCLTVLNAKKKESK